MSAADLDAVVGSVATSGSQKATPGNPNGVPASCCVSCCPAVSPWETFLRLESFLSVVECEKMEMKISVPNKLIGKEVKFSVCGWQQAVSWPKQRSILMLRALSSCAPCVLNS